MPPAGVRREWTASNGSSRFLDAIEQARPRDEDDAGAGKGEQPAAETRILLHIMLAAFHCPDGDCISDQPRFGAGLDYEQAAKALQHRHILSTERASGAFEPFLNQENW